MPHYLAPSDAAWLFIDKPEQPCHIACLAVFSPPPDAAPDFLHQLVQKYRSTRIFAPPFNYVLRRSAFGNVLPAWDELPADRIDLDYHFRHSALPAPGGERELGVLVSRLHSHRLDFRRPLWEMHLIEGLEGGRFAIYLKLHHSQFDGMAGVALWSRAMSTDRTARRGLPPWAIGMKSPQPESARPTVVKAARRRSGNTLLPALKALGSLVTASSQGEPLQTLPFAAPRTVLNGRIRAQRRVATQTFALDRIQAIARKADVSVNDVFMAICGGALRRYLGEQGLLPSRSLTAGMPVSVRPAGDASVGNAVTFMHGSLGTDIADPVLRLKACRQSALLAKEHLQQMPRDVLVPYTLMLMAPYLGQVALGLGGFGRPMHNLIVSNVPGERQTQYLDGARLERCFPISTLFNGQALNISVYSCGGTFSLGFVGCRDTLPRMQKLAVYTGDALAELEASLK